MIVSVIVDVAPGYAAGIPDVVPPTENQLNTRLVSMLPHSEQLIGKSISEVLLSSVKPLSHCWHW